MLRWTILTLLLAVPWWFGCGDDSQTSRGDGSADGGDGADDAAPMGSTTCPELPPTDGAGCEDYEGAACDYLRCDTDGVVTAACASGTWSVTTEPCEPLDCGTGGLDESCDVGQLCVMRASGALIFDCELSPCGDGPIACDCVCGEYECVKQGPLRFQCNTCPGPTPCP